MKLESREIINKSRDEVFHLVRDKLPEIAPYFPNIEKVDQVKYNSSSDGKETHILNHWYGKVEIPEVAQRFIKKELFAWFDHAVWKNESYEVEYRLESFWSKDIFEATGKNYFLETNDGKCELVVTCEVILHPDKVPGVPAFLVKKVLPIIEEMVKKVLGPNLGELGAGIKGYYNK